ncbi:invertase [Subtercola boreus]|uniref:Invertase n=1 Tax=Subtercola boreus TaxID=120213 RepID=A0A3E0VAC9_9MICO|nr:recombinase family protein [Subtercola boreus]RFA06744.1 invertase [Subtercola boreus]
MRLLGYTRVSTRSQDAQLQVDALMKVGVQQRDIFSDVTSGTRVAASRPAMGRLLEHSVAGDTVVVWRIDRLGRSLIDVLNTVKSMQQAGINVQSISDGIDPSTKTGRMMLGMLATLAEYERELIVERVNAGIAVAQAAGTKFGRPPSDPRIIAEKLTIVRTTRKAGKTAAEAAQLVGWSRATLYRYELAAMNKDD